MRPGLCLLLLGAAADDRVVLRRGDAAPVSVPPQEPGTRRALRREDAAVPPRRGRADPAGVPAPPQDVAVPPRRGRADPAGVPAPPPDPGRARRDLQASDDDEACQYVSVSGSTGQTSREGTYERVGECAARPYYECLDCSASDPQFIWYTGSQWFIGPGGCGATVAGMYINDATGDLAALTGSWAESPFTEENPAIAVECAPTEAPTPLARTGRWLEGAPCDYAILSGSTSIDWTHGTYQKSLCDDGTPLYTCLDCSSEAYIWYMSSNYWYVGSGGCGSTFLNMYIEDPDGDLASVSGTWMEHDGSGWTANAATVACAATLPPTMAPVPCDYVSVSGSTYQSGRHGLYEATETCDSKPSYECLDCSSSDQKIWLNGNGWVIGSAGCGSGSGGIFSPSDPYGDLGAVSGTWEEWTGSASVSNSDIIVTCYSYCKLVPGTTAKRRCFDCADASALATVGDGQCDAANNVSPCWDGGDCCEMTCIDGDTHTCGSYDCKDPDAPPWPDPYYPDAA